jgi:ATP-dependent helicase/nuclease subunit A
MRAALNEPGGYLQKALLTVSLEAGEDSAQKAVRTFIQLERKRLSSRVLERKFANSGLSGRLDLTPGDTIESVKEELRSGSLYGGNWQEIRDWLAASKGSRDQNKAKALTIAFQKSGQHIVDDYVSVFLKKDGHKLNDETHFVSKPLRKDRPDLFEQMDDERSRVFDLMDKLRRVQLRDRTEAIRLVAEDAFRRYHLAKRQLGRMDFADLIEKAVSLLSSDAASWVLYKLDQGIDHILVDEAQDTSPEQWQIVKSIAGDFFTGAGARGNTLRTLFAVGDEKQSIYGFQGARPKEFAEAKLHFQKLIDARTGYPDRRRYGLQSARKFRGARQQG